MDQFSGAQPRCEQGVFLQDVQNLFLDSSKLGFPTGDATISPRFTIDLKPSLAADGAIHFLSELMNWNLGCCGTWLPLWISLFFIFFHYFEMALALFGSSLFSARGTLYERERPPINDSERTRGHPKTPPPPSVECCMTALTP